MGEEGLSFLEEVGAKEERRLEGEELWNGGAMAELLNESGVEAMEVSERT